MPTNKKHFSDLSFRSKYVDVFPTGEPGEYSEISVEGAAYTTNGDVLMFAWWEFACDKDGYMTTDEYNKALFYGLGLRESLIDLEKNMHRRGIEIIDWDEVDRLRGHEKSAS